MGIEGNSILCFGVGAGRLGGMSNACGTVIRNDDNIKLSSSNVHHAIKAGYSKTRIKIV